MYLNHPSQQKLPNKQSNISSKLLVANGNLIKNWMFIVSFNIYLIFIKLWKRGFFFTKNGNERVLCWTELTYNNMITITDWTMESSMYLHFISTYNFLNVILLDAYLETISL